MKLFLALLTAGACIAGANTKAKPTTSKPVHVDQYTKKDGSVVHKHSRALPGTSTATTHPSTKKK